MLIAQELVLDPTDASTPNDNAHGAQLEVDFSGNGPVTVNSMHVLDVDPYEGKGMVAFYDATNNLITRVPVPVTGDNGVTQMVFTGAKGVMKMIVTLDGQYSSSETYAGSGAIDNISFCKEEVPPPPATCGTCEGKVSRMTFQYNGPEGDVFIQPSVKNGAKTSGSGLKLIGPLQPGESFTLDGTQNTDSRGGL